MTKVEVGKNYKCIQHKTGTSSRGPWEFVTVQDERGKNEITLFISTVGEITDIRPNQMFKVMNIKSVSLGVKKGKDDKWYPSYTADVSIEPIPSDLDDDNWAEEPEGEYSLPF